MEENRRERLAKVNKRKKKEGGVWWRLVQQKIKGTRGNQEHGPAAGWLKKQKSKVTSPGSHPKVGNRRKKGSTGKGEIHTNRHRRSRKNILHLNKEERQKKAGQSDPKKIEKKETGERVTSNGRGGNPRTKKRARP